MQSSYFIQRYEYLESIRDNQGGTFCRNLTTEENKEFCRVGLSLLKASSMKQQPTHPVQWRNRFYPEQIELVSE